MKVKLLLVALICTQTMYGSDSIQLLQEANRLADDLVKFFEVASEKSKPSSGVAPVNPVIDLDKVTRYPNIQIPKDVLGVVVPDDGQVLNLHNYELLYPVIDSLSLPKNIQHSHAHPGHNVIELPVLQQNRGLWQGAPVDMGTFGGKDVTYIMADLQAADGLNCGYHALKNVIFMLAAFRCLESYGDFSSDPELASSYLYAMQSIPNFTELLTPWLQFVIPYRYENDRVAYNNYKKGNMPSGTELEKLLGEGGVQPLIPEGLEVLFEDRGLRSHILILDSFSYIKDPMRASDKALQVLEKIITSEEGLYGFVVNSAACQPLATARGAHWFGYVVWKKYGKSTWLYTDSSYSPHDQVTSELLHICSQTPAEFKAFLTKRVDAITDEPLRVIESKLDRLNNSAEAYAFKFSCSKKVKLGECTFTIDDFKAYNTQGAQLVDGALVTTFNTLLQAKLRSLAYVSSREAEWQFSFWQKDKDSSWKVTYLDKKKSYDMYVYFELPDGAEDITILADIPDQIFASLMREPIGTVTWNDVIVGRIIKILNSTVQYMIDHKTIFASQSKFLDGKDRIFAKIRKDVGLRHDNAMAAIEAKFVQLFS